METCLNRFPKKLIWDDIKKDEKIIELRRNYVECLLKKLISEYKCSQKCSYIITGSNKITSDLDITLYGERIPEIINKFNNIIFKTFGNYPDVVFDTNLYSNGFLFIPVSNFAHIKLCDNYCNLYYIKIKDIEKNRIDEKLQTIWAFTHMLKLVNKEQKKQILSLLKETYIFKDIILHYKSIKKSNYTTDYTSELKKIRIKINRYEKKMEPDDNLGIKIKDEISRSNFYVHEAYVTQGAFFHVVVLSQLKIDVKLTKMELIHSAIENIGYYLYYLNTGIIKDKYIQRVDNALNLAGISMMKSIKNSSNLNINDDKEIDYVLQNINLNIFINSILKYFKK